MSTQDNAVAFDVNTNTEAENISAALEESIRATGYCYPSHRVLRFLRTRYRIDADNKPVDPCSKYSRATGRFMPGVLLVFCMDHNNLIGFHIMRNYESPKTVFELLFTRWQISPSVVCYDNACNLAKYCLAREYAFFRETQFVLDRLHVNAHTCCSPVYHPDLYPALIGTNTQLCEQINSRLNGLRAQIPSFKMDMWLHHIILFLHLQVTRARDRHIQSSDGNNLSAHISFF